MRKSLVSALALCLLLGLALPLSADCGSCGNCEAAPEKAEKKAPKKDKKKKESKCCPNAKNDEKGPECGCGEDKCSLPKRPGKEEMQKFGALVKKAREGDEAAQKELKVILAEKFDNRIAANEKQIAEHQKRLEEQKAKLDELKKSRDAKVEEVYKAVLENKRPPKGPKADRRRGPGNGPQGKMLPPPPPQEMNDGPQDNMLPPPPPQEMNDDPQDNMLPPPPPQEMNDGPQGNMLPPPPPQEMKDGPQDNMPPPPPPQEAND